VLTVSSPLEVRRALTKSNPKLEMAYLTSRGFPRIAGNEVDSIIASYSFAVQNVFGQPEMMVKQEINGAELREMGIKQDGEVLEQSGPEREPFSDGEIMRGQHRYAVLMRQGTINGVIDRVELASRIAASRT
jgi:hypothetical protein